MSEISIHDETENSVAIRKGHMRVYVFHIVGGELRFNGSVNAREQELNDVPNDVVSKAESHTGREAIGHTQEHVQRLERCK
jgi:hypothetical protein